MPPVAHPAQQEIYFEVLISAYEVIHVVGSPGTGREGV